MNPIRIALLSVAAIVGSLASSSELFAQPKGNKPTEQKVKMPDIAGEWLSDSPLDSFVRDDSAQPVNKFQIEKSDEADYDFVARYIGASAVGVKLSWSDDDQQFEGTVVENGRREVSFVVKLTSKPDVLKCRILSDQLLNAREYSHDDIWKRAPKEPTTPKTSGTKDTPAAVLLYDDGPGMTPQVKADTEKLLTAYLDYLKSLGFKLQKGQVTLRLQQGMGNAHYYPTNRSIVMDSRVANDESVLRREYNHHALSSVLGDKSKEIFESCSGIESALADYLGCSHCDDPEVGHIFVKELYSNRTQQSYLRTMDNLRSFTEVQDASGRHNVGEVVSGALWEMRGATGKETLDPLLYEAWVGLVKSDDSQGQIVRFARSLLDAAQQRNPEAAKKIRDIFQRRGLTLP